MQHIAIFISLRTECHSENYLKWFNPLKDHAQPPS